MNARLGRSELHVSRVGLGLWPIAGMTTRDVIETESRATLRAALENGINFFDTAFCYGADGISERLLGEAIRDCRENVVVATKCGVHWGPDLARVNDASPARLHYEIETSLQRLNLEQVDLLYLHSPDRVTPIETSAACLAKILESGKARAIGLSNATLEETQRFHSVCPLAAVQLRYNMFQREIEREIVPWCLAHQVSIVAYWPLMKGLLAGRLRRGYVFDPQDKRLSYPIFQGQQWERAQDVLDDLTDIARDLRVTVAQLVIAWTLAQTGISVALCGAKRPWQIEETARASEVSLTPATLSQIEQSLQRHMLNSSA